MLNIDDNLKQIYKSDIIPLKSKLAYKQLKLYFPNLDLTITNEQLQSESFEITESLCSDNDLVFGSCESAQLKVTVADVEADLKGQIMIVTQRVDGTYEMPLGTYTVDSAMKQSDLRFKDIIAYDKLKSTNLDVSNWYNGLTFPLTLANFRASLLSHLGIEEEVKTLPNDSMLVYKTINTSKIIGRDVLFACEEINGCFGHINRYGKFTHVVLEPSYGLYPSITLLPWDNLFPVSDTDKDFYQQGSESALLETSMYQSVRFEEYTVKEIDKLQIRQEEGDVGAIVGTGTNAYVIEGNFLLYGKSASELETIAVNAFGNMQKRPYRPFISENLGLPYIEVGDTVAFSTSDVVSGYVLQRTLKGIQALRDNFTASGNEERKQNFNVNKQIIQLQGKTNVLVRDVEQLSNTIADVEAGLESQITQTANSLQVQITDNKNNAESQITQMADNINLKVDKNGVIASINLSPETARIAAQNIQLEGITTINERFKVLLDGSIEATGAKLSGNLYSYGPNNQVATIESGVIAVSSGVSSTVITPTYLSTGSLNNVSSLNGGTPITSQNIGQQNVKKAETADRATLADEAVRAGWSSVATNADNAYNANALGGAVYISENTNLRPYSSGLSSCGTSLGKWSSVWANSGTIQTSDERLKTEIVPLENDERFLKFTKMIFPYTYKLLDGTSGRKHIGFIAQKIEAAMNECNITDMEFAGLIKAPVHEVKLENGEYDTTSPIIDHTYHLRYDEFVPLLFLWFQDIENKLTNL